MKRSELIAKIDELAEDSDLTEQDKVDIINLCLREVAGGADRPHGFAKLAPLPDLATTSPVTLDGETVSVPTNYQRGLMMVFCGDNMLDKYDSFLDLVKDYKGSETGTPEAFFLQGRTLHCRPGTSEDTDLTLYYYEKPTDLTTSTDDEVTCLPEEYHYKIIVNYVCREIFKLKEQDVNGRTPNTDKFDRLYQMAITDLEREIGPEDVDPVFVADDGDYI